MNVFKHEKSIHIKDACLNDLVVTIEKKYVEQGYKIVTKNNDSESTLTLTKGSSIIIGLGLQVATTVNISSHSDRVQLKAESTAYGLRCMIFIFLIFFIWPIAIVYLVGILNQRKFVKELMSFIEQIGNKPYMNKDKNENKICQRCEHELSENTVFCDRCGTNYTETKS